MIKLSQLIYYLYLKIVDFTIECTEKEGVYRKGGREKKEERGGGAEDITCGVCC